ncbi:MAG: hypothetical protein IPK97_06205 [Ahniella sp.]|nr:hypothetical protein [Ahniella sp.]
MVVNLSAPSSLALELNFSTFDGGGMNADATNPSDYLSTSGTLSFPPNVTTANIVVPIVGDTTIEPNRIHHGTRRLSCWEWEGRKAWRTNRSSRSSMTKLIQSPRSR